MSETQINWAKALYVIGIVMILLTNGVVAKEILLDASSAEVPNAEVSNAECECPGSEGSGSEGSGSEGSGSEGLGAVALAVAVANAVVFLVRGFYVYWFRHKLFNAQSLRRFNEATSAERVAVYVFGVLLLAFISQYMGHEMGLDIGSSLTDLGESVMLLAIGAPVITYLTSGYGQLREIVHKERDSSA